jgi:trk system potassium uptake protein TrkH
MIQLGGLGLMTVGALVSMALGRRIGLRHRMMIQEDLKYLTLSGLVKTASSVALVALTIEGAGALLLWFRWWADLGLWRGLYFAIFHSVSAFCNAGMHLFGDSLMSYAGDAYTCVLIAALFILGGLGFVVLIELAQVSPRRYSFHTRLVLYSSGLLLAAATVFVLASEYSNPATLGAIGGIKKTLAAFFQGAAPRTAGFYTVSVAAMRPVTLLFLMGLMFVGASPGSTGGGVKTTTTLVVLATLVSFIKGDEEPGMLHRRFSRGVVQRSMVVVTTGFLLVAVASVILLSVEPFESTRVLFEVVAAFSTAGLSTGITPSLSPLSRIVIMLAMFAGRVGPLTIAMAIGHKSHRPSFRYPEGKVMIG